MTAPSPSRYGDDPHAAEYVEGLAPAPKQRGSFFWGCLTLVIVVLVGVLSIGGCTWWFYSSVRSYTSDQPIPVPVYEAKKENLADLDARCAAFRDKAAAGERAELLLTADDLNAAIAASDDPWVRWCVGKVFFRVDGSRLRVDLSLPLDAQPGFEGRYLNGVADPRFVVREGQLFIDIERFVTAEGKELSELHRVVLSLLLYSHVRFEQVFRRLLRDAVDHIRTLEIRDGKVHVSN